MAQLSWLRFPLGVFLGLAIQETARADDAIVKSLVAQLADEDSDVRAEAAAELRRLLAGDFNARTDDHGRLYWEERLRQVKPGMKHEEVLRILPQIDENAAGAWSGGTGFQQWRLDDYWVVSVSYYYPDVVHEMRPTLHRRARQVGATLPADFTGTWTTWHVNGQKAYEIEYKDGKHHGTFTAFHDNGRKCVEQHYVDGTCSGSDRGWYADGSKSYEGQYLAGQRDGAWTHWYPHGRLQSREELREGELQGVRTSWHENGQKRYETSHRNGQHHGPDKAWDMNGKLLWSRVYRDGQQLDP